MMVVAIAVSVLAITVVAYHRKKRRAPDDPTDNRVTMTLGDRKDSE
jgi:uncharacterized protein YoxC